MVSEWRPIAAFPNYSVSDSGTVRNDETGYLMTLLLNQSGVVNVGLTKNRVQYKRAVALLVATAFITSRPDASFDCPINLDGDRLNNCVSNLAWRPRWFATKYFQQFEDRLRNRIPIEDLTDGALYNDSWDASIRLGLLYKDVLESAYTRTFTWPVRHRFRFPQ